MMRDGHSITPHIHNAACIIISSWSHTQVPASAWLLDFPRCGRRT